MPHASSHRVGLRLMWEIMNIAEALPPWIELKTRPSASAEANVIENWMNTLPIPIFEKSIWQVFWMLPDAINLLKLASLVRGGAQGSCGSKPCDPRPIFRGMQCLYGSWCQGMHAEIVIEGRCIGTTVVNCWQLLTPYHAVPLEDCPSLCLF